MGFTETDTEDEDKKAFHDDTVIYFRLLPENFWYQAKSEARGNCLTNFYPWSRDKLIIGKFCQIAVGVEFVMNDANHQMSYV